MSLLPERLLTKLETLVSRLPLPLNHSAPDVSSEQSAEHASISRRARNIGKTVRQKGFQEYGRQVWAEGYVRLLDGRIAQLQHGMDELPQREVLVVYIRSAPDSRNGISIRYDFETDEINTFRIRKADGSPEISYWIYDRPEYETRFPADLTLEDIEGRVDKILQSVENFTGEIMRIESEVTAENSTANPLFYEPA
ncbi:hypothetical protein A2Z33_02580 [Candidatus Gottesmanbacteria bacterium RBG_16_52_11]|uniref:Uncharacterized protein n=1 Tax=Candidatus Gottesmanbacteria bacterium RBG_16_52_11 TaxID=1798374 RepID=A0A1F5YMJ1_9BACT|nr:MAG: hypothetical protein A2Z33_02580 [Candidatus Gottesmanbacteria bacterium RBG_16_52_11]